MIIKLAFSIFDLLPGRSDDMYNHPDHGKKFLVVEEGGSLEIHGMKQCFKIPRCTFFVHIFLSLQGKYKRPWTRLSGTLTKSRMAFSTESYGKPDVYMGISIYEFDAEGNLMQLQDKMDTRKRRAHSLAGH